MGHRGNGDIRKSQGRCMNISKQTIELIYHLNKNPAKMYELSIEEVEDILATASDLAQYYEAEEQRRWEEEMRSERRR